MKIDLFFWKTTTVVTMASSFSRFPLLPPHPPALDGKPWPFRQCV